MSIYSSIVAIDDTVSTAHSIIWRRTTPKAVRGTASCSPTIIPPAITPRVIISSPSAILIPSLTRDILDRQDTLI